MNQAVNFNVMQEAYPTKEIVNLVEEVNNAFAEAGHPQPAAWQMYLNPDALVTVDLTIQRFLINRAFRLIINMVTNENTMDVRFCLVDNGEFLDWIRLFKVEVLPCLMRNQILFSTH